MVGVIEHVPEYVARQVKNYVANGKHLVMKVLNKSVTITSGNTSGSTSILSSTVEDFLVILAVKVTTTTTFKSLKIYKAKSLNDDTDYELVYHTNEASSVLPIPIHIDRRQGYKIVVEVASAPGADETETVDLAVITEEED